MLRLLRKRLHTEVRGRKTQTVEQELRWASLEGRDEGRHLPHSEDPAAGLEGR